MSIGINNFSTPQLRKVHSGKVRESFQLSENRRLIIATDRISAFDQVLHTPVSGKGAVLSSIANYWFDSTRHIVSNHFISSPHPAATVCTECKPIRVEMIVRAYITGSAWRSYEKGVRTISGATFPNGLTKNQLLPKPLVTPTTKDEKDTEISPHEIVKTGLCSEDLYKQMEVTALALFEFGSAELEKRGIILVDTKYEFGLKNGELILIDEIHTPDCSRFWDKQSYDKDPSEPIEFDKEYVRTWLRENTINGAMPLSLPENVITETQRRYLSIHQKITGKDLSQASLDTTSMARALAREGIIKQGYIAIIMGSKGDLEHAKKIATALHEYNIYTEMRIVSAHKNGERIPELVLDYNESPEPGAVIAIAGLSNGLGGALAANLNIPVINCPPFANSHELALNINSSLMMPSGVPAVTVIGPELAAEAALRSLNLPEIRAAINDKRIATKARLKLDDTEVRRMLHA
jgi:phosphoribosylaminoimidazole-succinocarboxamide synthase